MSSLSVLEGRNVFGDTLPHHASTRHRYSILKALRQAAFGKKGIESIDGLEREVSDEIANRSQHAGGAFFIPMDAPVARRMDAPAAARIDRRDLTTTTGGGAVVTQTHSDLLIDVLRSRIVCARLGARMPVVGVGKAKVPKRTTGGNVFWASEGNAPTEANPVLDSVLFSPQSLGGYVDVTRQLLASAPDAEPIVVGDLMEAIAHEVDRVALNGSGSGPEPLGMANDSSVTIYPLGTNGAALSRADLVALEKAVGNADGDAASDASPGFVTTPNGRAKLRLTEKATGTGRYLWGDDNRMLGMPAWATTSLPSGLTKGTGVNLSALLYGNFADLQISQWGAISLLADPFSLAFQAIVRFTAWNDVDVKLRHAESFRRVLDFVTT